MRKWFVVSITDLASLLDVCQKVVSIAAIIIGAIWTYKLFIEHRESYAKADIHHEVATVDLGDNRLLLRINVSIQNTGNTVLRLTDGEIQIERILPLDAVIVDEASRRQSALFDETERVIWPVVRIKKIKWERGDFEIEPGEHDKSPFEFILSNPPDVINITTYFSNPYKNQQRRLGWAYSSIIDLREARRLGS